MLDVVIPRLHCDEGSRTAFRGGEQMRMVPCGKPSLSGLRRETPFEQILHRIQPWLPPVFAKCLHRVLGVVGNAFHDADVLPLRHMPCFEHIDHMPQQRVWIVDKIGLHAHHRARQWHFIRQIDAIQRVDEAIVGRKCGRRMAWIDCVTTRDVTAGECRDLFGDVSRIHTVGRVERFEPNAAYDGWHMVQLCP